MQPAATATSASTVDFDSGAEETPVTRRGVPRSVWSLLLLVLLLCAWEFGTRGFEVPKFLFPPFSDVVTALWRGMNAGPMAKDGLWLHTGVTLAEIVLGFVLGSLVGLALAIVISESALMDDLLRPYIAALQSLPKVAVAPIIVTWLGFGLTSKVAIVCLITFFPVLVTSIAGFKAVDIDRIDLLRSLSATRWQIFCKVKVPGALPYIFAGLDMAAAFSVVGAIVGEFVGAQAGLGVLILQMEAQLDTAGSFAVFTVLSALGIALTALLRLVRRRLLGWMPADTSAGPVST